MGRLRRTLPLVAWLATLGAGLAVFHGLGSGPLAAPPLTAPSEWGAWAADREPLEATVAVLRLVVLALAWYLVGVTTVGLVARLARAARLVRIADALTVPVVRRLLQGALGLGLATAMVGAAVPAPRAGPEPAPAEASLRTAAAEPGDVAEVRLVPAVSGSDQEPSGDAGGSPDEVELRRVDDDHGPLPLDLLRDGLRELRDAAAGGEAGDGDEASPVEEVALSRAASGHEVRSGESMWTIARDTLEAAWGRAPDDGEVVGYWHRLIEDNRDRLEDPDNPDLIFPGQEFVLPEPPPADEEV